MSNGHKGGEVNCACYLKGGLGFGFQALSLSSALPGSQKPSIPSGTVVPRAPFPRAPSSSQGDGTGISPEDLDYFLFMRK